MDEFFDKFYFSNENIFGPNKLWDMIKQDQAFIDNPKLYTKKQFMDYIKKQEDYQINKPIQKPQLMHPIYSSDNFEFQIDLTFYNQWAGLNKGYNAILNCIEITSRKLFSYPVKSKTASEILDRIKDLKTDAGQIKVIECDAGNEFINNSFKKWCEENDIKIAIFNNDKHSMGMVERVNRTIRDAINKIAADGKWLDVLPIIVEVYNKTKHSSLEGYTPNQVFNSPKIADELRKNKLEDVIEAREKLKDFQPGDKVRFYIDKKMFAKGRGRFSKEVHEIEIIEGNSIFLKSNDKPFRYYQLMKIDEVREKPMKVDTSLKEQEENLFKVARRVNKEGLRESGESMADFKNRSEKILENTTRQTRSKTKEKINEQLIN